MTYAFTPPAATIVANSLVLDAARSWRKARDSGNPVQPALYRTLDAYRCGILAPVIDSVLSLYEACSGQRFRTGTPDYVGISGDEHRLLSLLRSGGKDAPVLDASASPDLARVMRIALRSARIMLRLALEPVGAPPSPAFGRTSSRCSLRRRSTIDSTGRIGGLRPEPRKWAHGCLTALWLESAEARTPT